MPHCRKCDSVFPNRIEINGKFHNFQRRVYCLDCSPFGLHNTKVLEGDKQAIACGKSHRYSYTNCTVCNKPTRKGCRLCNGCTTTLRRIRIKSDAVSYCGGVCMQCGWRGELRNYEFHHRDSSTKLFNISEGYYFAWSKIVEELDKCDLLCTHCHRVVASTRTTMMQVELERRKIRTNFIEPE